MNDIEAAAEILGGWRRAYSVRWLAILYSVAPTITGIDPAPGGDRTAVHVHDADPAQDVCTDRAPQEAVNGR